MSAEKAIQLAKDHLASAFVERLMKQSNSREIATAKQLLDYARGHQKKKHVKGRRHASVMTMLKNAKLKEVIGDATKRSKGSRLKGIE